MAVGAIATEYLDEIAPPKDGRSTPSICMEWLVMEAFERRRNLLGPNELRGVPGSGKVEAALSRGERLTNNNYLKTASVFGFTGVLMPLARSIRILNPDRTSAERAKEIALVWEHEQGFDGFSDGTSGSDGSKLRASIRDVVIRSLLAGRCEVPTSSPLLSKLAESLRPDGAGTNERQWLSQSILDPSDDMRAEIGRALSRVNNPLSDRDLVTLLRPKASDSLRQCLDAIVGYEAVATRLESVMHHWQYVSTLRGITPVTPSEVAASDVVQGIAKSLSRTIASARSAFEPMEPGLMAVLDNLLERFDAVSSPEDLAQMVMEHHEAIQSGKSPFAKRPWFEPAGSGYVVRSIYRVDGPPSETFDHFGRQYRLSALRGMLGDLV